MSETAQLTESLTPTDALELSLFLRGQIDLRLITQKTGLSSCEIYRRLCGHIYYDPKTAKLVTASEYLSGNILKKLNEAKKAMQREEEYGTPARPD